MSSTRKQRAVMATNSEWERIGHEAKSAGKKISQYIVQRTLMPDSLPPEVMRRAVRELLVLSKLEERRLREAGNGEAWDAALRCGGRLARARGGPGRPERSRSRQPLEGDERPGRR